VPHFYKTELFRFHKVINEPDFLPVYFVVCSCKRPSCCGRTGTL